MIDRTLQRCWVAAVIRDDDGNVLVARWADTQAWDLPSGTLRVGEDVCTGVRRVVADSVSLGCPWVGSREFTPTSETG